MDSHVSGGITPLSLGELRQAILAVVVGSPRFSPAEQLHINHAAHEIEDADELAVLLRGLRMKDAERGEEAMLLLHHTGRHEQPVCYDVQAQLTEVVELLGCRLLGPQHKHALVLLAADAIYEPSTRLRFLGDAYAALLHRLGRPEGQHPRTGLFSN